MDDAVLTAKLVELELRLAALEAKGRRPPFHELPPDPAQIVRLRAQRFHNAPKQGVPADVLKLSVWLSTADTLRGDIAPFFFYLGQKIDGEQQQVMVASARAAGKDWSLIGCLHQRRRTEARKGQRCYPDQAALILQDRVLLMALNGHGFGFATPVHMPASKDPRAPGETWFWP